MTNNKPKQASIKIERRKAERLSIPLKVKYKIKGTAGRQKDAPWEDISGLGIRFCLNNPLSLKEELEIALYVLGDSKPIEAIGRVAWCKEFDKGEFKTGVEFIKIKDQMRFTELICRVMLELSSGKI
jgi:c-di-GMP-binding flagellar brake protein YcgR